MIPGIRGRLVTATFLRELMPEMPGITRPPGHTARSLLQWARQIETGIGAASSVRAVADVALLPLLHLLDFRVVRRIDSVDACRLRLQAGPGSGLVAVAIPWGQRFEHVRRSVIFDAVGADVRWCLCCNGVALRLIDARRTWSRDYLEFDVALVGHDEDTQSALWALLHSEAIAGSPARLDRAVDLSRQHGLHVCRSLGAGVLDALATLMGALKSRSEAPAPMLWAQSLTVLYRLLFLLFAEARGLVPVWHPAYRDRYSIGAIVSTLLDGRPYRGLWRAVQAISRLAHAGCAAGDLAVTAFNGRLFAPDEVPAFDRVRVDDLVMSRAVVAIGSSEAARGGRRGARRARIAYRDLDVEQLGAVYERVLDYSPGRDDPASLVRTRDVRKSSGTFYTPRAVTDSLVRRTLEPLVSNRSSTGILELRVLDPAMGSGAFLVAACRYLAQAAEDARVREGRWHAHDITPADRVALRREVASRCLFGVDSNPMAVQLARLSLWLATLAADRPLSFLDHHLLVGNSLVGATPADLERQPGGGRRIRRPGRLPLLDDADLPASLEHAAHVIAEVSLEPDESAAVVRKKERRLVALRSPGSTLARWSRALDLWCAGWFWGDRTGPDRATFLDLVAGLLDRPQALPPRMSAPLLTRAASIASSHRFLHWPLAFPDVFAAQGTGFDAIVGNPPWDMVRGDSGESSARDGRRLGARQLTTFVRESGIFRVESRAHVNLYQLFVERALQLARPGGRVGFVLPSGIVSDSGAAPLRRHLFERAAVDEVTGLDNRHAIFPVHRSVRFVLMTCTAGRSTTTVRCRFGLTHADQIEAPAPAPLFVTRRFIARLSGEDDLGIPELTSERDLAIVEKISAVVPRLGREHGWHVAFGRELNASDDRGLFEPATPLSVGRRVVEGKQVEPFRVDLAACRLALKPGADVRVPRRARLAYRDVASSTNRLTLIAAIVPASAVTTHTLFCLRTPLALPEQQVLCALLNSYVANYLIRLRVGTHVTVSLVSRLPVPVVRAGQAPFGRLHALADVLATGERAAEEADEYVELQAMVAQLYGLSTDDFAHVLDTFPLVPGTVRRAALDRLRSMSSRVG